MFHSIVIPHRRADAQVDAVPRPEREFLPELKKNTVCLIINGIERVREAPVVDVRCKDVRHRNIGKVRPWKTGHPDIGGRARRRRGLCVRGVVLEPFKSAREKNSVLHQPHAVGNVIPRNISAEKRLTERFETFPVPDITQPDGVIEVVQIQPSLVRERLKLFQGKRNEICIDGDESGDKVLHLSKVAPVVVAVRW